MRFFGTNAYAVAVAAALFAAGAATAAEADDWSDAVKAGAYSNRTDITEVAIPTNVTSIGRFAFQGCSSLTNVVIGECVTNISASAFADCTSLQSVSFPDGLVTIGASAFSNCTALASLDFPETLSNVGNFAFDECHSLTNVDFALGYAPPAWTNWTSVWVSPTAFTNCANILEATLPAGKRASLLFPDSYENLVRVQVATNVSALVGFAFEGCSSLETVSLPEGVTNIGVRAFANCTNLAEVAFPDSLVRINSGAFSNCTALANLDFPETLSIVDGFAFAECHSLTNVDFSMGYAPPAWTNWTSVAIYAGAFTNCENIASVTIPANRRASLLFPDSYENLVRVQVATNIPALVGLAFEGCSSLETVSLPESVTNIGVRAFADCTALRSLDLPDAVETIGSGAFSNCAALASFSFPSNLAMVGARIFEDCPALAAVEIPEGVTNIGVRAFANCTNLAEVAFPDSLVKIDVGAFSNCTALANLEFPETLTTVAGYAFAECHSITNVDFAMYFSTVTNFVFETNEIGDRIVRTNVQSSASVAGTAFTNCANIATATMQAGRVAKNVFPQSYENLVRVQVATNVANLFRSAFEDCAKLETVILYDNVTTIPSNAFANCVSLGGIELPETIRRVEMGAFSNCTALASIELPDTLSFISTNAFYSCAKLTNVVINAESFMAAADAFEECAAISSATLFPVIPMQTLFPDSYYASLKHVNILVPEEDEDEDGEARETVEIVESFCDNCRALQEIAIPSGVSEIGARAFFGCIAATDSVTIPATVTGIGDLAFAHCRELDRFYYLGNAPSVSTNIYYGTKQTLVSAVARHRDGWATQTSTNTTAAVLPLRWPTGTTLMFSRPIAWWDSPAQAVISFFNYDGLGHTTNVFTFVGEKFTADMYPESEPSMRGYTFEGWYTAKFGGYNRSDGFTVTGTMTLYPHWTENAQSNDPFPLDDPGGTTPGGGEEEVADYDFSAAHTYAGYLADGDAVVGTAAITIAKGRYVRSAGETVATVRATLQVLGVGKLTLRGTMSEDGTATLSGKGYELEIAADSAGVTGSFEGYELSAWENLFSAKTFGARQPALAQLDDHGGSYTAAILPEGAAFDGYAALGLSIGARGKTKVTGMMPDGTKINATAQMIVSDDVVCLPVVVPMYAGKKGGFGFLVNFYDLDDEEDADDETEDDATDEAGSASSATNDVETVEVSGPYEFTGMSPWYSKDGAEVGSLSFAAAAKARALSEGAHAFQADISAFEIDGEDIEDALTPDGTEFEVASGRWRFQRADTVRFTSDEGYETVRDNGNPAALKLTYNARYGTFKGTFKVFCVTEAGRAKRRTATVNGVVVDGVGYGSAVIKKVGAIPVSIE